jgi:colicin import membrane protein
LASSRKHQPQPNAAPEEANAATGEPRRAPGRFRAVFYAALVHAIVIAALVIGFRWSGAPTSVAPENTIQAVVAEDPEKKKQEDERRRRQDEERKTAEAERKRQETEAQKREEERRLEERRKQAEAEKLKQAEAKRKEEERKKVEAEAVERKRAEAEARKKREQETQQRKVAEDSLKQQLAEEEGARAEAARAARAASEADKYRAMIRQKVSRNWARPAGASTGLKCLVRVRLAPGGDVLDAKVVKGSGNALFDRSVEVAVHKASPLPIPAEADLFQYFREIEFQFTPEA